MKTSTIGLGLSLLMLAGCGSGTNTTPPTNTAEAAPAVATPVVAPPPAPAPEKVADAPSGPQAGQTLTTAAKRDGIFYGCATEAQADYVNTVLGFMSMQARLGVHPNVDPTTGEPQYEGESKALLDDLRGKAGVSTFDEAVAHCQNGPYRRKVQVMNAKPDQQSTWVMDTVTKTSYWLPAAELDAPKE